MTAKRFKLRLSKLGDGMIIDTQKREDLYFDKEFLDATLPKATEWLNKFSDENEQLKKRLDELKTYDKEEFAEVEHINDIYKEKGFCGVITYAKDKLQYYGVVKEVEKGLWVMVTGGWSDNEFWLNCLNNPISIFGMKHYRGYLRGGAFYYTEKPRGDVEIILKGDVE